MVIAANLGADVPYFLFGGRALGISRGDEIYPLPDLPRTTILVVAPAAQEVSTAQAYGWLGRGLTTRAAMPKLWAFCALCWSPLGSALRNDFEAAVFRRHPRLARIKRALLEQGAADASLAGSGSAVFGTFLNPAKARRAARKFPEDVVFLCATISRRAYGRALWGAASSPLVE
jgi:4-diphosphocytidyl-2-C-methyl-D-erythritol kinase